MSLVASETTSHVLKPLLHSARLPQAPDRAQTSPFESLLDDNATAATDRAEQSTANDKASTSASTENSQAPAKAKPGNAAKAGDDTNEAEIRKDTPADKADTPGTTDTTRNTSGDGEGAKADKNATDAKTTDQSAGELKQAGNATVVSATAVAAVLAVGEPTAPVPANTTTPAAVIASTTATAATAAAGHPDINAAKASATVDHPDANTAKPSAWVDHPDANTAKPSASVDHPDANTAKPSATVEHPDANTAKPSATVEHPDANTAKPSATVEHPDANTAKPSATVEHPDANTAQAFATEALNLTGQQGKEDKTDKKAGGAQTAIASQSINTSGPSTKEAAQLQPDSKPAQPTNSDAEMDKIAQARGETPTNDHRGANENVAAVVGANSDASAPKMSANATQPNVLIAPSHHAAATPTTPLAAAAPQTPQVAAVPLAGVAIEITNKALAGKNQFDIRLDPPELGRIHVRLNVDRDGNVTSRLIADRSDTLDLLRRDTAGLERALQDAGLKTSDNSLQFSLRDQSMNQQQENNGPNTTHLVVEDDTPPEHNIIQHVYSRLAGQGSGIDIQV